MRKNFNSVQMLETSEVCDKFSKSVSYETLVGGTATTGRGIKQNQRLIKGSANKPLTAVGTLTSLLCNSAKVMEKLLRHVITRRTLVRRGYLPEKCTHANEESLFASVTWLMRLPRRIQRMLLVMTIPALALLFTIATTGESRAESEIIETYDCGKVSGTVSCNLYDDGTLKISGSGAMVDYNYIDRGENIYFHDRYTTNAPWAEENITKVVVGDGVTSIGNHAFTGNKTITSVEGMKNVTTIGPRAFFDNTALEKIDMPAVTSVGYESFLSTTKLTSVELPNVVAIGPDSFFSSGIQSIYIPKVTALYERALRNATNLSSIDMPSIRNIGDNALKGLNLIYLGLPEDINVNFGEDVFSLGYAIANCSNENRTACGSCGNGYVMSGLGCVSDCGAGYLGKDGRCIDASLGCGAGYRQFENFCNRIQYTPAEAAQVLKDDDNFVILTFKK